MKDNDALQHQIAQGHITVITQADHAGRLRTSTEKPTMRLLLEGKIDSQDYYACDRFSLDYLFSRHGARDNDRTVTADGCWQTAKLAAGARIEKIAKMFHGGENSFEWRVAVHVIAYEKSLRSLAKKTDTLPALDNKRSTQYLMAAIKIIDDYYSKN